MIMFLLSDLRQHCHGVPLGWLVAPDLGRGHPRSLLIDLWRDVPTHPAVHGAVLREFCGGGVCGGDGIDHRGYERCVQDDQMSDVLPQHSGRAGLRDDRVYDEEVQAVGRHQQTQTGQSLPVL